MTEKQFNDLKKGDKVVFKVATRSHCRKATRIVKGKSEILNQIFVGYHGWAQFALKPSEISKVIKA